MSDEEEIRSLRKLLLAAEERIRELESRVRLLEGDPNARLHTGVDGTSPRGAHLTGDEGRDVGTKPGS